MGKKVKKAVSGAFKGIRSLTGAVTGGLLGSEQKSDNSALEAALEQQHQAALKQQRQAAENVQVDLSVENVPTIETGGTAESQAESGNKARRRRRTGGLSSSLGINVG